MASMKINGLLQPIVLRTGENQPASGWSLAGTGLRRPSS